MSTFFVHKPRVKLHHTFSKPRLLGCFPKEVHEIWEDTNGWGSESLQTFVHDRPHYHSTNEQSLEAIKAFTSQNNNEQPLDHIQRLDSGNTITVGAISGLTAVTIGYDTNIIVNQVLPQSMRQPLENVQKQWFPKSSIRIGIRDRACAIR